MKMVAIHTVNLGGGKSAAPGSEFEISDKKEAEALIDGGAAVQKTRTVADDDDDAGEKKPLAEVIAMADVAGISAKAFKAAAKKWLGDATPNSKDEILTALKALPPETPA